jgi:hypothetical protein
MRLLDFVEENHGIWFPPDCFRELAAFIVARYCASCIPADLRAQR